MLVLSRRPGEKFLFPGLGVSVEVLRSRGNIVRLGIDAPDNITVLRGEIATRDKESIGADQISPLVNETIAIQRHALQNQLNHLTLKLELLKRQLKAGVADAPDRTLSEAIADLSDLENTLIAQEPVNTNGNGRRILVVEDQAAERELLADCLRLAGFEVVTVADGAAALDYLRDHEPPELVLLDMRMPGIDGPAFLDVLRGDGRLKDLRVFAVSGSPKAEFPSTALAVDGWFPKPLRIDSLIHAANMVQNPTSNSV